MRETSFIRQNEKKWKEFEQVLEDENRDPEKLNELFIQVTDDLSYARTFYPNRSVRVYLNGLAQRIFFRIYRSKKSRRSRFIAFWTDELPLLLYQARKELLFSFLIFVLAMAIGMLSSAAEPDFLRLILGDSYVEMTEENIASGDPMAVYKQRGEFNMFLGITLNNLVVALQTFLLGVFYAIGTVGSLLYNGIMLGAFQYFFIEKGLFLESFLAVWLHGAFEISSIVIAGAAGITMGKGLVFPGTLSRLRSFQLAARRGLSILIGVAPLFIIAGFIESFLTRFTDAPDLLRFLFIVLCLAFVGFYFVAYPVMRSRLSDFPDMDSQRLNPEVEREIDFSKIKTTGDLLSDSFVFFRKNLRLIAWTSAAGSFVYCLGVFLFARTGITEIFTYQEGLFGTLRVLPDFFVNKTHPWLFPLTLLSFSWVAYVIQRSLQQQAESKQRGIPSREKGASLSNVNRFIKVSVIVSLFILILQPMEVYTVVALCFTFPLLFHWSQVVLSEHTGVVSGLGNSMRLISGNYLPMTGLFLTGLICGIFFFLLMDTGIVYLLLNYVSMNFFLTPQQGEIFHTITITYITYFVLLLTFGFLVTGSGLQYYTNREINEASDIRKKIGQIRPIERIRGMDRE